MDVSSQSRDVEVQPQPYQHVALIRRPSIFESIAAQDDPLPAYSENDQAAFQQNLTRKSQVLKPRVLAAPRTDARDATTGEFGDALSRLRQQLKSISVYRDVDIQQEGSEASVTVNRTGVNDADQENDSENMNGVARHLVDRRLDPLQAQLLEVYPPSPGTCEWIHKHPKYEKWRNSENTAESPILLVLSDPGLGKSVLAKSILLSLEREGHPVMAFFCRAGTADRESTTSILASFIHRLLEDIPKLSEHIINSMANELDSDRTEISFDSLWKLFVRITQDDHMNAFTFIIDAIDECVPQSQGALERALLDSAAGIGSKILFTARFERYPMSLSKRFPSLEMESDVISADMTTFISDVIRSKGLENMNNACMVQVLKQSMDKGAEGMFLRIAFRIEDYLAELDKPTFSNSQEYLEDFFSHTSGRLFDYWGNVLDNTVSSFDEKAINMAAKVFNLMLASQVMVGESVARAAFAFSEQHFSTYDGYLKRSESDIFDRAKRICGPFLRIRKVESFKTISIVHPTAREFLERTVDYTDWKVATQGLSRNSLDLLGKISVELGHALMARACLSFLLLPELAEVDPETSAQYPFLPYAVLFLTLHIRESKDLFTEYADYLHKFFAKSSLAFKVWHTLRQWLTEVEATEYVPPVIIFLVENRLEKLVDVVIRHGETSHTFFDEPLDINAVNESDISALELAIGGNQEDVVATLLKLGASTQTSRSDGITPLHLAVMKGMENVIRALKAYNADFNAETKVIGPVGDKAGGKSPLFYSFSTLPNTFALLLDLGTTQTRRSADKWSILHEAALEGQFEAVKMIVEAKLFDSVDIASTDGWTPLHAAAGAGASLETVLYLCNFCQADVNRRSSSGLNALYEAVNNGNIDIVRFLLPKIDEEDPSSLGWTALHIAAYNGSLEMVKVLLSARFNITKQNENGDTALYLAIQEKHEEVAMLLLEANRNEPDIDIDQPNKDGYTAIFRACCNEMTKVAGLLIDLGANTGNIGRSAISLTCLHMVAYNGNFTLTADIIVTRRSQSELGKGGTKYDIDDVSSEISWTPLFAALFHNHTKIAKFLLESGADPTITSSDGWNALHMAARYTNDDSLFEILFAMLDDEQVVASANSGDTPLHFAAISGLLNVAKQLLLRTADPFAQNKKRVTPLFNAAMNGHSNIVELFLASDGEFLPDLQTSAGWTVLDAASLGCDSSTVKRILETTNLSCRSRRQDSPVALAVRQNNLDVIDVLIQGGISVNLSGSKGWTALHEAAHRGKEKVVFDLIEKHKADITQLANEFGLPLASAYHHRNDELNRMLLPQDIRKFRRFNIVDTYAHAAAASTLFAVKSLVKLGLPVTDIDGIDDPCLSQAAVWGLADIIEYLLQQPGVADQVNFRGRTTKLTPLHLASRACNPESIALLLAAGGSATDEDIFGYTAYDYALRHEQSFTALVAGRSLFQIQLYRQKYRMPERRNRQRILRLVCVVITWIQNESSRPKTLLTPRDKRSAIAVLLQAFFMLGDIDHASTAFELLIGPPSSPAEDMTFICYHCLKHCELPYFACHRCPCIYLCESCSKKTQLENVKGCFQHDFTQLPRQSWYTREHDEVSEDRLSESSWLESVLSRCEQEKDLSYIWPPVEFPYEYEKSRTAITDLCRSSDTDRLQDHLTNYPRDIVAQDKDGQTLPSIFIQFAGSDAISLSGLKLLAREGADLLEYTLGARSTVQLACEKEFPLSLAFLLEERSSSFDTVEDEFASTALKTMILKTWKQALYAAIMFHFDWFARGEYTWLQDLRLSGLTEKDIAEILESSNLDYQSHEETIEQNFWAVFSQPLCLRRPILGRHRKNCVHELKSHLLSAPVRVTYTADVGEEDGNLGEKYFDTDSDISTTSHDIDAIGKMCGLAGLFPDSDRLANFTVSDDLEETCVSIRYPYHLSTILFETVKKAGLGLLEAFRTAQDLELCCDSFVVLYFNSDKSSTNLAFLRLEMIYAVRFIDLAISFCDPSQKEEQRLTIWESITQVIREVGLDDLTNISILARSSEDRFDICCLILQFFGLGFTLFLGAHLSRYVLPVLETAIARFTLLGCTGRNAVEFRPYRMACLERMMQDNVVAFSIVAKSATKDSSYLDPAEQLCVYGCPQDLLDIWGPGYCIRELDNTVSPTGKLSAIELRGGRLVSNAGKEETLRTAHWSPTFYESSKSSSVFTLEEKLLIGTLRVNGRCKINLGQSWARASSNGLENLDTSAPYWNIVDWTLNVGFNAIHGGGGVAAKLTEQPGRLKKTSIIECWRSGKWKVLDGPWGVRWSVCTGFVERVPLRRVVGEVLDDFIRDVDLQGPQGQVFPPGWSELRNLLRKKLIGGPLDSEDRSDEQIDSERFAAFMSEQRDPSDKVHVYSVVTYILEHLKNTGLDSQGTHFQVAWTHPTDNLSTYQFECSGQSKWTTILQDTRKKATFAIATADCLVSHLKKHPFARLTSCRCLRPEDGIIKPIPIKLLDTKLLPYQLHDPTVERWRLDRSKNYSFLMEKSSNYICKLEQTGRSSKARIFLIVLCLPVDIASITVERIRRMSKDKQVLRESDQWSRLIKGHYLPQPVIICSMLQWKEENNIL